MPDEEFEDAMEDVLNDPEMLLAAREARIEAEEEARELEDIEEEAREHGTDLPFALLELQWRGDYVRIEVLNRSFTGEIIHVGEDIVTLTTKASVEVDINTANMGAAVVVERAVYEGRAKASKDPKRFIARLREISDIRARDVEFGGAGVSVRGSILRVHGDHVWIRASDKKEFLVPIATLAYVIRGQDQGR